MPDNTRNACTLHLASEGTGEGQGRSGKKYLTRSSKSANEIRYKAPDEVGFFGLYDSSIVIVNGMKMYGCLP